MTDLTALAEGLTGSEAEVAKAIMQARVEWGWKFGKRARVMAIDMLMAKAAIAAMSAHLLKGNGDATA